MRAGRGHRRCGGGVWAWSSLRLTFLGPKQVATRALLSKSKRGPGGTTGEDLRGSPPKSTSPKDEAAVGGEGDPSAGEEQVRRSAAKSPAGAGASTSDSAIDGLVSKLQDALASVDGGDESLMAERVESLKCAVAGAAAGAALTLPYLLWTRDIFGEISPVLSCALFALVYRYAVSALGDNMMLRQGVVLAFALTRGLSPAGHPSLLDTASATVQSLILFAFAAAALEYGFQANALQLFGKQKSD